MLDRFPFIDSENDECDDADDGYSIKHSANLRQKNDPDFLPLHSKYHQ